MSQFVDLSLFQGEPLVIKGLDGTTYTIPASVSTKFIIKFANFETNMKKLKDVGQSLTKMQEMVAEILNLDPTQEVDLKHVQKHFDDMRILKIVIEAFGNHMQKVINNPN